MITSEQVRAARALLRIEQSELARSSGVSLPSIKRLETQPGLLAAQSRTAEAIKSALESAGVIFVEENGEGPGVRLRKAGRRVDDHATQKGAATEALARADKTIAKDKAKGRGRRTVLKQSS